MLGYALVHIARFRDEDRPAWAGHLGVGAAGGVQAGAGYLQKTGDSTFTPVPPGELEERTLPVRDDPKGRTVTPTDDRLGPVTLTFSPERANLYAGLGLSLLLGVGAAAVWAAGGDGTTPDGRFCRWAALASASLRGHLPRRHGVPRPPKCGSPATGAPPPVLGGDGRGAVVGRHRPPPRGQRRTGRTPTP